MAIIIKPNYENNTIIITNKKKWNKEKVSKESILTYTISIFPNLMEFFLIIAFFLISTSLFFYYKPSQKS